MTLKYSPACSVHALTLFLIVLLGSTNACVHDRRTLGSAVDDMSVELKSGGNLSSDPQLKDKVHINATSVNGIVLLTGEAPSAELRDRVLTLIRAIPSIRRITNEIRIAEPSSLGARARDNWLTSKVESKLVFTKGLQSRHVKVITENASVYLMGLVTQQEGELATRAASSAAGVARVVKLFEYVD